MAIDWRHWEGRSGGSVTPQLVFRRSMTTSASWKNLASFSRARQDVWYPATRENSSCSLANRPATPARSQDMNSISSSKPGPALKNKTQSSGTASSVRETQFPIHTTPDAPAQQQAAKQHNFSASSRAPTPCPAGRWEDPLHHGAPPPAAARLLSRQESRGFWGLFHPALGTPGRHHASHKLEKVKKGATKDEMNLDSWARLK
ncbi:hypothetical protein E4U23_001763 [Claviceps purpurea]|nr:hypothetical protein E4U23_001763 [Claviceps purpurea]